MKKVTMPNVSGGLAEEWRKARDLGNKVFLAGQQVPTNSLVFAEEMADMLSRMQTGRSLDKAEDYGMQR